MPPLSQISVRLRAVSLPFVVSSALVVLTAISAHAQGDADLPSAKIFGGREADTDEHPWMVALADRFRSDLFRAQFCGAVLIDPLWVVTAAHCVDNETEATLEVALWAHNLRDGGVERVRVAEIIRHPSFFRDSRGNLRNDVALLRLERPIEGSSPMRLVADSSELPAGSPVRAFGWGRLGDDGQYPSELRTVDLLTESLDSAQASFDFGLGEDNLPAFSFTGDTCEGDSGGPLVSYRDGQPFLAGLTSFGFPCGESFRPGIYANISHLRPWILEAITGTGASYLYSDSQDLGGGWGRSPWFGDFNGSGYPWLYTGRFGWIYATDDSYSSRPLRSSGLWFWQSERGWFWTSPEVFPWVFRAGGEGWTNGN